jgi:AraC family ethanolamine operon transcriptional activator
MEISSSAAQALREQMVNLKQTAASDPGVLARSQFAHELSSALPYRLLKLIMSSKMTPKRPTLHVRHRALRKAVDYINAATDNAISVSDLCRITGSSERMLAYAFKEHFGISPKRYLVRTCLNAVHRTLAMAAPEEVTVADVANHHGFWHMGQFAADYKRLFGRLPSNTLRTR